MGCHHCSLLVSQLVPRCSLLTYLFPATCRLLSSSEQDCFQPKVLHLISEVHRYNKTEALTYPNFSKDSSECLRYPWGPVRRLRCVIHQIPLQFEATAVTASINYHVNKYTWEQRSPVARSHWTLLREVSDLIRSSFQVRVGSDVRLRDKITRREAREKTAKHHWAKGEERGGENQAEIREKKRGCVSTASLIVLIYVR